MHMTIISFLDKWQQVKSAGCASITLTKIQFGDTCELYVEVDHKCGDTFYTASLNTGRPLSGSRLQLVQQLFVPGTCGLVCVDTRNCPPEPKRAWRTKHPAPNSAGLCFLRVKVKRCVCCQLPYIYLPALQNLPFERGSASWFSSGNPVAH